ncbi:MAG: alcohol dehydrogenase catalytic domain-containing protein, partial [Actinobacteria bacterium]|nr:alcohol dehydrogenase catalytic domain-containing protein [Actinomycetota bacterium]
MKAVVFVGGGTVQVEDVPQPKLRSNGDAIVKVTHTAICGSDLHLLSGHTPGMRAGSVIGHEFVGTVHDAGGGVTSHLEGARVLGSFLIACGSCAPCRTRRFNLCTERRALGLGTLTGDLDGAQAEYVRVPSADVNLKSLIGDLSELSDEEALFGGDILATGFYGASLAEMKPDETAIVIGAGPVGIFTAGALARVGKVVMLDTDARRVAAAQGLGFSAAHVVDDNAADVVTQATEGEL